MSGKLVTDRGANACSLIVDCNFVPTKQIHKRARFVPDFTEKDNGQKHKG